MAARPNCDWIFNHFHEPEFSRELLTSDLLRWTRTLGGKPVAVSSLKRDVEVFLRTYVPSRPKDGRLAEDSLDCPLVELELIVPPSDGRTYRFRRGLQESLPDGILFYAVLRFWQTFAPAAQTLALHDLARQPGSPGRLFKIDESSLVERLEGIERGTEGGISYAETAGLRQLYRRKAFDPHDILCSAYAAGGRRR